MAKVNTLLLLLAEPKVLTEARIGIEPSRALVEVRGLVVMWNRVAAFVGNASKQQVEVHGILVIVILKEGQFSIITTISGKDKVKKSHHNGLAPVVEATMQVPQVPRPISQSLLQRHFRLTNFLEWKKLKSHFMPILKLHLSGKRTRAKQATQQIAAKCSN